MTFVGHLHCHPCLGLFSLATSSDTKATFLRELRNALVNVGFFYLTNPPVAGGEGQPGGQGNHPFDLPLEKKLEIEMVNSKHFLGYSRLGQSSQLVKSDYREQFDWPDETAIPGFRHALESYLAEVGPLADEFQTLVAEALDLPQML
ncbi:uncharacterized protein ATNIH1004_001946 [Aspergillus tanneri]|uniref:Non-haem dioxygenase N-terminal domain-containing protein n=1 Tax=Aspergillus tanneri TaxID=1220188 RepID=A0A5M9M447_9EURO|nr:uncharacterized protein ATNIH1004_001946 [Aspergillus tanneri]KAA8641481.1 hypothetical protein ATNIH1004_001946 [Aspergillus tanneri]